MAEQWDIKGRTFDFAVRIVDLCRGLEEQPDVSTTLVQHLFRSGTAVGAQVDEAHGNPNKSDFIAKMAAATEAARGTHYWLRLLVATEAKPASLLAELLDETGQLVAILTTIVKRSREHA